LVQQTRRVMVAMSGGVDSSTVAALLLERGYHVEGLTMSLWREPSAVEKDQENIAQARAVCDYLGIPLHVLDLRQPFLDRVVRYFVDEYTRARTPNPCLRCNRMLKFGVLIPYARQQGADYLATGHYVRVRETDGVWHLLRGVDRRKDQSYVLYALQQEQLRSLLFPLGEMTKDQVRAYANQRGLPVADRPESQDVCFIQDNDYRRFLREHAPETIRPGPILDAQGNQLGTHHGLPYYTVGQREGLGIAAPRPLYVLELDIARNALIVGYAEELGHDTLLADEMSYVAGTEPPDDVLIEAKIRYRAPLVPARVYALPERQARVVLDRPLRDITPGQAVVLYQGEEVLGGGIIQRTL
jgi:tRNA-specific 2-thiouridylase